MYEWLPDFLDETFGIDLSRSGASEEQIANVESALRVPLPPSYREFLKVCNGGEIYGYQIFSTDDLLQAPAKYGFKPYKDCVDIVGDSFGSTYAAKPANLLPVAAVHKSPDLYCLDVCPNGQEEKPICKYDHEVEDINLNLQPRFPDFEAFFLDIGNLVSEELENFLEDDDDLFDENKVEQAEEKVNKWQNLIHELLAEGGADMTDPWDPGWSEWRGSTGRVESTP